MELAVKYFFSYSREDSEFVLKLAKELRAQGVQVWMDRLELVGGQRWDSAIERALEACQGMIVVLTPASLASHNVMDEVSYALEERKLVVPVVARACTVPFRLRRVQRVDFTENYDAAFAQLLRALGIKPALGGATSGETHEGVESRTRETEGILREEAQRKAREHAQRREAEQVPQKAEPKTHEEPEGLAQAEAPIIQVLKPQRGETERDRLTAPDKQRAEVEHPKLEKSKRRVALVSFVAAAIIGAAILLAMNRSRHAPGAVFQDCADCPQMVVIPAGSFMMGSPASELGRDIDEGPQHPVRIARQFAAGKFEVTFDEWNACVRDSGCGHNPDDLGLGRGRNPVMNVSWDDAKQYVQWLSRKTGKDYRLLTEAEWEYVARAGTTTVFSWGDSITPQQANYDTKRSYAGSPVVASSRGQPAPVGSYAPNAFGLYDVHGNVYEWTEDCPHGNYQAASGDGSASSSGNCSRRVVRGGAWGDGPEGLRSAKRYGLPTSGRDPYLGFRVARTQ